MNHNPTPPLDEGYIKFTPHWHAAPALDGGLLADLIYWRQQAYAHGFIGAYPDGIGFGNISQRFGGTGQFIISGSATGNFPAATEAHFTLVTRVVYEENALWCSGPCVASSESMSHFAVYNALPWVGAVLHAHHLPTWQHWLGVAPTTPSSAAYGTPAMVESIIALIKDSDLPERQFFVMEGHREGLFSFGATLEEALEVMRWHLI